MAFEIVKKGNRRAGVSPGEVNIAKSGFSISKTFAPIFADYNHAEIYFDREDNKVGIKPTNDVVTGFKLVKQGNTLSLAVLQAIRRLPIGSYPAKIEDGIVVFEVPEIALPKKNGQL